MLSFVDICNCKSLGFMHVNSRSLLPKVVLYTALAHSANPDVVAMNPGLGRLTKTQKSPSLTIPFSDKIELPKGAELQSTAEIGCIVMSYYPGLCPNNLSLYF